MGSSLSRGRKFSPKKNGSDTNPNALLGHAKFSYADPPLQKPDDFIEKLVCKVDDIDENEMKVFDLGSEESKILLIKQEGKIHATGVKCTHYGAPLIKGHLGKGRIRCPWHGACFNIATGDIEDFPGLDSLPCYEVKISDGEVRVRAHKELLASNKRVQPFVSTVHPHISTFVVVGGGAAGATCVENLRTLGFDGRLIFIMAENHLPYDRVKLSKALDFEVDKITLRSREFYQERNIELILCAKLIHLSPCTRMATLDNGESVKFDKIFLATGSTPRRLEVSGSRLKNIFVLRTAEDAKEINSAIRRSSKVVILGTSFIGMEIAAFFVGRVSSVTVIGRNVPFKYAFGSIVGDRILKLYEEKDVIFYLGKTIQGFEGENGYLKSVSLSGNLKLPADICIMAIGTTYNTNYFESSGIQVKRNGPVEVNEYLQTSSSEVFAGGDIAVAPVLGQKACIGHWGLASYHGHIAACNMMGQNKPLRAVPFFWTSFFGKTFRHAGHAKNFDDMVIDGSIEDMEFIVFYCTRGVVSAVTTINRDPLAARFAEMLYEGKKLQHGDINGFLNN